MQPRSNKAFSLALLAAALLLPCVAMAQETTLLPDLSIQIGNSELGSGGETSTALKIVVLLTALSFAPAMILTMTCFTRIAVVLGMVRTALGVQSLPPTSVITGLALYLTFVVMNPVVTRMYDEGVKPYMDGQMSQEEAISKASLPLKEFLVRHSREKDLALFLSVTGTAEPQEVKDLPFHVAVPAFVLSELNMSFQIGFLIALPFLVLDMVVSSVLTSLSMITLPPVVISLPLKLMLFVVVDGWHLIVESLLKTYQVG